MNNKINKPSASALPLGGDGGGSIDYTLQMIKYNFRIIFGGKFLWFILAALAFYFLIAIIGIYDGDIPDEDFVYGILIFPAILLIFYPMTFGIQNDLDTGILEILFGIPNYRYKVWLVRLVMVFTIVFFLLIGFALLSKYLLAPVHVFEMVAQLMFPFLFLGNMAFWLSTVIKNGNGTAVVVVVIGVLLSVVSGTLENTMWDIFIVPFDVPNNVSEMLWGNILIKNRLFLVVGSIIFFLGGLFNLQKRERFI
ncbi:MAG: hypothetical protein ACK5LR_03315 [Mangrovibacterium sp.]